MSEPDNAAAYEEFPEDKQEESTVKASSTADYETLVVTACNEMKFDDSGKWTPPEGMSEELKYAINSERRRRDTQSTLSKSQQELKAEQTRSNSLTDRLKAKVAPSLSVEEAEELEDLKESNPDAWRAKLNVYEQSARAKHHEDIKAINEDAAEEAEIERRNNVFEEFKTTNPELELNDYVFKNDLPQRITGKLESGESSFEVFLSEAKEYLEKGKVIAGSTTKDKEEPNLSKAGGYSTPTDTAAAADIVESYKTEIF